MYLSKRARLSSSITLSPSEKTKRWSVNNMASIVFAFFIVIGYIGLVYLVCSMIRFFGVNMQQIWEEDQITVAELFTSPWAEGAKVIGVILIIIYVIRNGKRS